jgi:hypothetical protein
MKTTLNKIRAKNPCHSGWSMLMRALGKTRPDDEPISIATILNSNGLEDALWCLSAVEGSDREIRLFAIFCARQVQHLMTSSHSLNAVDVAERFANGNASAEELVSTWNDSDKVSKELWELAYSSPTESTLSSRISHAAASAARRVTVLSAELAAIYASWDALQCIELESRKNNPHQDYCTLSARGDAKKEQENKLRELCS